MKRATIETILRCLPIADSSNTRVDMSGVLIDSDGAKVTLKAHDGFALILPMRVDSATMQAEINSAIFNKEEI